MKITFVLPEVGFAGGIRVIAIYADRLKKRGHEVLVISTPSKKPSCTEQVKSLLKGRGWIAHQKNSPSYFDNIDVPHKVLERYRPVTDADVSDADVVVATCWETAEWVANLSETKGAKAYFIQPDQDLRSCSPSHSSVGGTGLFLPQGWGAFYVSPDRVVFDNLPQEKVAATWSLPLHKITISQWLVDLARTQYGDSHVSLVFNSVDTEQFHSPNRGKQSTPTVGMLYSPDYSKGCDVSFKAFSLAAQKIPGLRLIAFGTSEPSKNLPLPIDTQYIQKPTQDKIKDIYASCDVWLCGSWSEGFHLPPLEAMACRTPVVSTQIGGSVDVVEDGVNGYLVPVGNFPALANQLVRVLTLPEAKWRAMSKAAYATATGYTWDDATKRFEGALYTAIVRSQCGDFSLNSAVAN
jgi:glycosyltransferase involved in cell wall biosynthesis